MTKKTLATAATVVLSGTLLTACGGGDDFQGTWTGQAAGGGNATVVVDGSNCSWEMTEADGRTNDARCERDDEEFKLADPLTGQDLDYTGSVQGDTLTLAPDNSQAEKVGALTLTKTGS
ncbi:hypothetical protein [Corynebacterium sp.]|nr:hypothetical protein [Corynebacterium sp.]MDY5786269.1 hypothetical protein [Corynebacterium sp.]